MALAIATAARVLRSLSYSGAAAATILGTLVYGFAGWRAALVLITFFVSSSLLGRLAKQGRARPAASYAKGTFRDAGQVLSNGFVAGLFAVAIGSGTTGAWPWLGYAGAIAAVTADTWATELGVLSSSAPRLITHLRRRVPAGTSGGISPLGTLAAVGGAALIGWLTNLLVAGANGAMIAPVAIAGLAGALFDSFLGATVQSMYRCGADGMETEQHPRHHCGAATAHIRGWTWLDNDKVNLASAILGAVLAIGIGLLNVRT